MSSEPTKTPSPRRLMLIGAVALAVAGTVAAKGIVDRAHSEQHVVQWTDKQVIPTVALAKLERGDAHQALTLPGSIQPYYRASIYARVNGYLKSWTKDIGAQVKAGEVLASIEAPDLDQQLAQARATLASAKANSDIAAITANRNDILAKKQIVAQQLADQTAADAAAKKAVMDATQANVRQLEAMQSFKQMVAPFDGLVTARNTDIGALINSGSAGQPLFEISDLHRVRIYVRVPQAFSAQVRPGLKAAFEMPQYPGQQFDATVVTISNALDVSSRSMLVELQADNAEGKLFAGAYCQVHFQLPGDPNMVRVPATALVPVDHGAQVALLGADNKVVLKPVQLGRDFGDSVEVVAGLSPSDRVIDSAPETVQSGDEVQLTAPTRRVASSLQPAPAPVAARPPPAGSPQLAAGAPGPTHAATVPPPNRRASRGTAQPADDRAQALSRAPEAKAIPSGKNAARMQAIALGGTSAPPSQADTRPQPPSSLKVVAREDVNPAEPQAGTLPNAQETGKVASEQNPSSVPTRASQPASGPATPPQADHRPGPAASNRGASQGAATARLEAQAPVLLNPSAEQDIRAPGASQSGPTASASAPDAAPKHLSLSPGRTAPAAGNPVVNPAPALSPRPGTKGKGQTAATAQPQTTAAVDEAARRRIEATRQAQERHLRVTLNSICSGC